MDTSKTYIQIRQKELDGNIDAYCIGNLVKDDDARTCCIVGKMGNSLNVFIEKKTDKGIDATQWFYIMDFEKRFTKI